MKRFLVFATAAATMFSSCTKQYVDDNKNNASSGAIEFNTHVANSTKGVAKTAFVMGDQFFVYGGKTGSASFNFAAPNNSAWAYNAPNFVDLGARVSNYGDNVWRYDNPVSWDESMVTFFAFSPVPDTKVDGEKYGITMAKPAVNTIPTIDFVVKGGYDVAQPITSDAANASRVENKKQVDLLWACAPDKGRVDKTINLDFGHALTQLNFSVRSNAPAGHMIRVNTIAVKNVATKATLALGHDLTPIGELGYLGGWSNPTVVKSFPVNLKNSVAALIKDNAVHAINDGDEALMMIPQDLTNVELEVCYAYSADGITWEEYKNGTPVIVKLGGMNTHTHWNPNKAIRYVLNITPGDVISFTAKVEDWGTEGDIEIINVNPGKNANLIQTITLAAGDTFVARTGGWITYDDGNGVKPLTTTPVTAIAASCKFAVLANNTPELREDQIIIQKVDGFSQTIIKIAQSANDGTFNIAAAANANVMSLDIKAGDVVAVPQIKAKAAATWVKYTVDGGAETEFSGDYTASADAKIVITVTENLGVARSATVAVTPKGGKALTYTINQEGVAAADIPLTTTEAGGKLFDGVTADVVTLIEGGGAWLTMTDTDGAKELVKTDPVTAITANGTYTIDAAANTTQVVRTAKFTVVSAGVTKTYVLTQAAAAIVEVPLAAPAAGSKVHDGLTGDVVTLVDGGGAWLTMTDDGGRKTLTSTAITASGAYTIDASMNFTQASRTAKFTVVTAGVTKTYLLTQAGNPIRLHSQFYRSSVYKTGLAGDEIKVTSMNGDCLTISTDGGPESVLTDQTTTGSYEIFTTTTLIAANRESKFEITSGGATKQYLVQQNGASPSLELQATAYGLVLVGAKAGDVITLTEGGNDFFALYDNDGKDYKIFANNTPITTTGIYWVVTLANLTIEDRSSTLTVNSGGIDTKHQITQKVTDSGGTWEVIGKDTTEDPTKLLVLVGPGQRLIGQGVAAPDWLTVKFTDGTEYNFVDDLEVPADGTRKEGYYVTTVNNIGADREFRYIMYDPTFSRILLCRVTQSAN